MFLELRNVISLDEFYDIPLLLLSMTESEYCVIKVNRVDELCMMSWCFMLQV